MSVSKSTPKESSAEQRFCARCHRELPPEATFCSACGERVATNEKTSAPTLLPDTHDINTRYRITSLIRRRPYISLFLAIDNQQHRTIAIRDLDVSSLEPGPRETIIQAAQAEYDLLRRQHISSVLPVIDLRYAQNHLFVIAGWPINEKRADTLKKGKKDEPTDNKQNGNTRAASNNPDQLQSLQDLLQSGLGLPDIQTTLDWIEQLCQAVGILHQNRFLIGELDPSTVIIQGNDYMGQPALIASWLPPGIQHLLPQTSEAVITTPFSAPETLTGKTRTISDIYSLGAILYLLLTGVPPDPAPQRLHNKMKTPREYNPSISIVLEEIVMRALALETTKRFQNTEEFLEALTILRMPSEKHAVTITTSESKGDATLLLDDDYDMNSVTVRMKPLSQLDLRTARVEEKTSGEQPASDSQRKVSTENPPDDPITKISTQKLPDRKEPESTSRALIPLPESNKKSRMPLGQRLQKQISQWLPVLQKGRIRKESVGEGRKTFLQMLQSLLLGEQQHGMKAAAMIETPLRILPNQGYAIRIQVMGRDEPVPAKKGETGGLSTLTRDQWINIEVRTAFHQSYTYVVQQAAVQLPSEGYAAEVIIPMKPFSKVSSGRRERLHIFFLDEQRSPLYESPFAIEIFVSHLVQPGKEGHQALPIPY